MSIAPHEGQELDRVIAGTKPMGSLPFTKYVEQMRNAKIHRPFVVDMMKTPEGDLVVTFAIQRMVLQQYRELVSQSEMLLVQHGLEWYQRKMGNLFGYTNDEIDAFVKVDVACDCVNCVGMSKKPTVKVASVPTSLMQKTLRVRNTQYVLTSEGHRRYTELEQAGLDLAARERQVIDLVDNFGSWL